MRLLAILPFALLGACQVSDEGNNVTVSYDQEAAENAVDNLAAGAKEAGNAMVEDTKKAGAAIADGAEKVGEKVEGAEADIRSGNEASR